MQIFANGVASLPETMSEGFTGQFSQEILKNVFNEKRRYDLSVNEANMLSAKNDRGLSIDEGPELSSDPSNGEIDVMKLKKTTVLTGNHALLKQQRNRAQSENEIFTAQFKPGEAKKYVPKTTQQPAPTYVAYRKKSHAV